MDKKVLIAAGVVVVLAVAAVGVYLMLDDEPPEAIAFDDAELMVFGNVNGDRYIDNDDVKALERLVDDGASADEYPLADANRDGKLDSADVDIVKKVSKGEKTVIYHVNQFDSDGDGTMDLDIVSTHFPIKSAITLGTGNNLILFYLLGIHDEIKGASYASSADAGLYGDIYMDESKVAKLGTSPLKIPFEDGKAGSSNVIAEQNVTAVIANHSQSNLPNWETFENAGIDVVRIATSSADPKDMVHYVMLTGLLFQKVDAAEKYLDRSLQILTDIVSMTKNPPVVTALASTMTGHLSVGDSDYRDYIVMVNGKYALDGQDYGDKRSIKIKEHPEVYLIDFERILHCRSGITYDQTPESNQENWDKFTEPFSDWKNDATGHYAVSTSLPVPLRVAFIACALYPDLVTLDYVNGLHQSFMEDFYDKTFDLDSMHFLLTPQMMA